MKEFAQECRATYGVPAKTFVYVWQTSATVDIAFETLKKACEKANLPVMPRSTILNRAARYRSLGLPLKKMRTHEPLDISDGLQMLKDISDAAAKGKKYEFKIEVKP